MSHPSEPNLTEGSAVYRHYSHCGKLLYVGMSARPQERSVEHMRHDRSKQIGKITVHWFDTREEASREENRAIAEEKPLWNRYSGDEVQFVTAMRESLLQKLDRLRGRKSRGKFLGEVIEQLEEA